MKDGFGLNVDSDGLRTTESMIGRELNKAGEGSPAGVGSSDYGHHQLQRVAAEFADAVHLARRALTRNAEEHGIGVGNTAGLFEVQEDDTRRGFGSIVGEER
ncbi:hypothetical protein [Streptomyces reniochalinae]|uniref:hypothetical protein n=1 Tax=Streptomyces reniochalinae TaxID=2250578 RepID=UPI0011C050F2|nr:hypothetical protein [Streptomyces reniochalinae]